MNTFLLLEKCAVEATALLAPLRHPSDNHRRGRDKVTQATFTTIVTNSVKRSLSWTCERVSISPSLLHVVFFRDISSVPRSSRRLGSLALVPSLPLLVSMCFLTRLKTRLIFKHVIMQISKQNNWDWY